jgi:hypothetical protein
LGKILSESRQTFSARRSARIVMHQKQTAREVPAPFGNR